MYIHGLVLKVQFQRKKLQSNPSVVFTIDRKIFDFVRFSFSFEFVDSLIDCFELEHQLKKSFVNV